MKITYRLTRWDIFSGSVQQFFHKPLQILFIAFLILLFSYWNWTTLSSNYSVLVRVLTVVVLAIIVAAALAALVCVSTILDTFSERNKTLLAQQTLTIDDRSLLVESEYLHTEVNWKALQRFISTRNYLFLYFSKLGAILIPRHAFHSGEEWDKFLNLCLDKLKAG